MAGRVKGMNNSKTAVAVNSILGHLLCLIGYSLGTLMLIALLLASIGAFGTEVEYETILVTLIFLGICVIGVIMGTLIKRRLNRFRQYVSLISLQKLTSIGDIAARRSKPVEFVRKDLQKMIGKSLFINATIDMVADKIIICTSTLPTPDGSVEHEVFHCPGCGAAGTRVKGMIGYCDYCGSPVQ